MEGKLVKTNSTYHLVIDNKIIASMGDSDGKLHKLSLKNCDAIANDNLKAPMTFQIGKYR